MKQHFEIPQIQISIWISQINPLHTSDFFLIRIPSLALIPPKNLTMLKKVTNNLLLCPKLVFAVFFPVEKHTNKPRWVKTTMSHSCRDVLSWDTQHLHLSAKAFGENEEIYIFPVNIYQQRRAEECLLAGNNSIWNHSEREDRCFSPTNMPKYFYCGVGTSRGSEPCFSKCACPDRSRSFWIPGSCGPCLLSSCLGSDASPVCPCEAQQTQRLVPVEPRPPVHSSNLISCDFITSGGCTDVRGVSSGKL